MHTVDDRLSPIYTKYVVVIPSGTMMISTVGNKDTKGTQIEG